MRRGVVGAVAVGLLVAGCGGGDGTAPPLSTGTSGPSVTTTSAAVPTAPMTPNTSATPSSTRTGPPEPTPVGDTSADGLWGRAAEVVCAELARQSPKPSGTDKAEAAAWVRDTVLKAVDQLEAVPGNGKQGQEMRDILFAIGTQSAILVQIYRTGNGNAASLEAERERSTARLERYTTALKAPSCVAVVRGA